MYIGACMSRSRLGISRGTIWRGNCNELRSSYLWNHLENGSQKLGRSGHLAAASAFALKACSARGQLLSARYSINTLARTMSYSKVVFDADGGVRLCD